MKIKIDKIAAVKTRTTSLRRWANRLFITLIMDLVMDARFHYKDALEAIKEAPNSGIDTLLKRMPDKKKGPL